MLASSIAGPSSNWLSLKKTLQKRPHSGDRDGQHTGNAGKHGHAPPHKKRKLAESRNTPSGPSPSSITAGLGRDKEEQAESGRNILSFPRGEAGPFTVGTAMRSNVSSIIPGRSMEGDMKNGESLSALREMVLGPAELPGVSTKPGKYLAIDCEMVGVGPEGAESSLARVSVVNFHGAVLLDELVRQRERVTDYRTEWSGIRAGDMARAKPFQEVQERVAALTKDCVLIGHAVHNDLKALLLSHPRDQKRDTQACAAKSKLTKSNRPALRHLVEQELGILIQGGEHSSITDARATMAIYRLHRKEWDKGLRVPSTTKGKGKRELDDDNRESRDDDDYGGDTAPDHDEHESPIRRPSKSKSKSTDSHGPQQRKGVSSGLSTVVKYHGSTGAKGGRVGKEGRRGGGGAGAGAGTGGARSTRKTVGGRAPGEKSGSWWTALPSSASGTDAKGSMRL